MITLLTKPSKINGFSKFKLNFHIFKSISVLIVDIFNRFFFKKNYELCEKTLPSVRKKNPQRIFKIQIWKTNVRKRYSENSDSDVFSYDFWTILPSKSRQKSLNNFIIFPTISWNFPQYENSYKLQEKLLLIMQHFLHETSPSLSHRTSPKK